MSGTTASVAVPSTDAEYEVLCDDAGQFLRRYASGRSGAPAVTDTALDGVTPYTPTGAVVRCGAPVSSPEIASTVQRQTGAGTLTIPAGARSVTVAVYAGEPTLTIGAGTPVALLPGTSLSWGVHRGGDLAETLADAFTFTAADGDDLIVSSTREA
ncbi:hypothetical protein [Streptomyces fuscigenes]|uniref:hypothetical protein n=1 Tax=Streptomyces fuscigenes TaxID=1528880 RepID=UPI001F181800|nr:hypothetical protein [Streptomyces fuscigenes]MCF3960615.1 hypothetical protein [Streptomyces fuscigenes]